MSTRTRIGQSLTTFEKCFFFIVQSLTFLFSNIYVNKHHFLLFSLLYHIIVTGLNFEITFISEKHVVEDDVLFMNHLAGK